MKQIKTQSTIEQHQIGDAKKFDKATVTKMCNYEFYFVNTDFYDKVTECNFTFRTTESLFKFMVHLSVRKSLEGNVIPLPQSELKYYFTSNKTYLKAIKLLIDEEYLIPYSYDGGEIKGHYRYYSKDESVCKSYRVTDKFTDTDNLSIVFFNNTLSCPAKYNEIEVDPRLIDLDPRYIDTIKRLGIDYAKAIGAEINHCQSNSLPINILVDRINRIIYTRTRPRFIKMGQKVNRIYHTFSNISRVARAYLTLNKKPIKFQTIDIKNSQPLLLIPMLKAKGLEVDANYVTDCENGMFYERFIKAGRTRDEAKVEIYRGVLFNFNEKRAGNAEFKEIYPQTWESIKKLSAEEQSVAAMLQNTEAELFNNLDVQKYSFFFFTLFDAVYFSDVRCRKALEKKIKSFFTNYGVNVSLSNN
jgi:hypothetical protein